MLTGTREDPSTGVAAAPNDCRATRQLSSTYTHKHSSTTYSMRTGQWRVRSVFTHLLAREGLQQGQNGSGQGLCLAQQSFVQVTASREGPPCLQHPERCIGGCLCGGRAFTFWRLLTGREGRARTARALLGCTFILLLLTLRTQAACVCEPRQHKRERELGCGQPYASPHLSQGARGQLKQAC